MSTGCSARLGDLFPDAGFGFHIHNLSGMATANILAALDAGVQWLEGAICGIGGGIAMPTKLGSVGNFPTEDLVTMLAEMGIETGIDPEQLVAVIARDRRDSRHRSTEPPRQRRNAEIRDGARVQQSEHEVLMTPGHSRSLLAVPATSPRFLEKAAQGPADAIFIDLEDAVINALKPKARGDAIAAINQTGLGRAHRRGSRQRPWHAMGMPRHP